MKRRNLLALSAGALAAPSIAYAQAKYPDRTMRLVVPFAPAGPTDIIGRMVAEKITTLLGQTMVVENKSGAAGSIGAVEVKNAKPDGYTFLFAPSSTHAINPTAFVHPAYDAVKDFSPVSMTANATTSRSARASQSWRAAGGPSLIAASSRTMSGRKSWLRRSV